MIFSRTIIITLLFTLFFPSKGQSFENTWKDYEIKTNELYKKGDYEEAINMALASLNFAETSLPEKNLKIAAALNNLIVLYQAKGDSTTALELCEKLIPHIQKAVENYAHPYLAQAYHLRGTLRQQQGNNTTAENDYLEAIKIYQEATAINHPIIIPTLIDLAKNQINQAKYEQAEMNLIKILMIAESAFGPEDLKVAKAANNLGEFYQSREKLSDAEFFYKRALKILTHKSLWEYYPTSLDLTKNMYALYTQLKKTNLAKKFKVQAQKISTLQLTNPPN